MNDRFLEQRISIKFCVQLGKNAIMKSSLEMKHGVFNMIPRASAEVYNITAGITLWPKEAHMSKSQLKTLLITSFDIRSAVHIEFTPHAKESTKLLIWKYRSGYMKLLGIVTFFYRLFITPTVQKYNAKRVS
jgi:hypothetical protein